MNKNIEVIAAGIIINENKDKVLLIQRKDKLWGLTGSIPGGHVEFSEKIINSLKRELIEELNLKIVDSEFLSYEEIMHNDRHLISFNFFVFAKDSFIFNEEIETARWFKFSELNNIGHKIPEEGMNKIRLWLQKNN